MGHLLNHSPTSLNQGAMGGKEEGQQVFNLRNGWNFHFLPSPSIQPNLLWCHLPTEIRFLSIALPQLSETSSSVKGRLTAFLQRNDHQKWKYCHFLLGQLWLTSQAMGKQEQWPVSDWFALSEMWEVHPISQPIHWGGKKEAEMTHFFPFYQENSVKELLNLCLLQTDHLSRFSGSCPSPGVTTRIMLAHTNSKCHI